MHGSIRRFIRNLAQTPTQSLIKSKTHLKPQATAYFAHNHSMSSTVSKPSRADEHNSAFFVCDIQETFRPLMRNFPRLITVSKFMIQAGLALNVPIVITEQVPFKPTASELMAVFENAKVPVLATMPSRDGTTAETKASETTDQHSAVYKYSKSLFSMVTSDVEAVLKHHADVKNVFLFGIEGHVCVKQTCMDLLERGYDVHLVVDAIESQRDTDLQPAIAAMTQAGAKQTTAESALYAIMKDAKHPKFKSVLPYVKEHIKGLADL